MQADTTHHGAFFCTFLHEEQETDMSIRYTSVVYVTLTRVAKVTVYGSSCYGSELQTGTVTKVAIIIAEHGATI